MQLYLHPVSYLSITVVWVLRLLRLALLKICFYIIISFRQSFTHQVTVRILPLICRNYAGYHYHLLRNKSAECALIRHYNSCIVDGCASLQASYPHNSALRYEIYFSFISSFLGSLFSIWIFGIVIVRTPLS